MTKQLFRVLSCTSTVHVLLLFCSSDHILPLSDQALLQTLRFSFDHGEQIFLCLHHGMKPAAAAGCAAHISSLLMTSAVICSGDGDCLLARCNHER